MIEGYNFAVFVDRNRTVCFDRHYLSNPEGQLIPTVADGIKRLNDLGIPVIVVANQSGVGRGFFNEDKLKTIHNPKEDVLAEHDASLDDISYCPHMPDSAATAGSLRQACI
jgi:histidinol phosphatase-like enzyme